MLVPTSMRRGSACSLWGVGADTTCRAQLPGPRPAEGPAYVVQSSEPVSLVGWPLLPATASGALLSHVPFPPGSVSRTSPPEWRACSIINVGQAVTHCLFLGNPADREVRQPQLVGPDLRVTAEVALQAARGEKSSLRPGCEESTCLAWPHAAAGSGSGNSFSPLPPRPAFSW